ncbi:MAG TPA: DUF1579 domain-containing protein [Thermoanaerobaculia bacterium]|nr:DUF1579 domain-containing protein [Thermoanaerobaculia bacterium]
MKGRFWLAVLSMFVLLVTTGGLAAAQGTQEKAQEKPAGGAPQMSPEEMQAMVAAATPGEAHKRMAQMAGNWTYTMTMWMAPGQPPMETTGTIESSMVLGGRYLQSTYKGNIMGQPFEGRGTDAWDNVSKEYIGTWMDNMGTGIMVTRGKCDDPACKKMTATGEMNDPMTGGPVKVKMVTTHIDKDNFKFEMFMDHGEHGEMKTMEVNAKRKA